MMMLKYKSIATGVLFEEVDEKFSTQTCSTYGALPESRPKGIAGLGIRDWTCTERNILARGHVRLAEGTREGREMSIDHEYLVTLKEFLLTEAPELIGDNEIVNYGSKLFRSRDLEHLEDLSSNFNLWRSKNTFFVTSREKLCYVMKFTLKPFSITGEITVSEIMIWTELAVPSVSSKIFFDHLLKEHHLVVADQQPIDHGARFWYRRAGEALKKELFVYYADQVSTPRVLIKIYDYKQFNDLIVDPWKQEQAKMLLISDHQLKPKSDVQLED